MSSTLNKNVEFQAYLRACAREKRTFPFLRMGQVYFNVLDRLNAEFADSFRGTAYDPFFDDNLIGEFLCRVYLCWEDWSEHV